MSRRARRHAVPEPADLRATWTASDLQVSFRLQRLESHVAFALGGIALWIGIFLNPPGFAAQMIALLGVALAGWSRTVPARTPRAMFIRALLLVGGGTLLMTMPGAGGPTGPGLSWALATTLAYALLLPLVWGAPVALLSLIGFLVACQAFERPPGWQLVGAYVGVLAMLSVLFLTIGRSLRASELRAEQTRLDDRSNLYNEAGFFSNGGELFDAARRKGEPFTLALLHAADLGDASQLLGRKAANALFDQTVRGIAAATPSGGIAARIDIMEFAVAMPGLSMDRGEALLHQKLGRPPQVKVGVGGSRAVILLDVVVAQAPPELHTLEDFYERLRLRLRERVASQSTQPPPTDHGGLSTLHGFLMHDPPVPQSQKPTLPMPLTRMPGTGRKTG